MNDPLTYRDQLLGGHWFGALPPALQDSLLHAAVLRRLEPGNGCFAAATRPAGSMRWRRGRSASARSARAARRRC